ncbi:MAG: hypothetical protein ACTSRG_08285 [Candidatus Helarchaeota archaeon]
MLHNLFILRDNGVCVFEYSWTNINSEVDGQIFSGFITALTSFAIESMGDSLQSLKLVKDQRLSILKHSRSSIIGVIIADVRDNGALLNKLLHKILERFYWLFRNEIEREDASLLGKTKDFYKEINLILRGKIAERSIISLIIGYVVGSILSIGIALIIFFFGIDFASAGGLQNAFISPIFINLFDGMQPWEFLQVQQIAVMAVGLVTVFFIMIFFGPGLIGAYIAGSRKLGIISNLFLVVGSGIMITLIQDIPLFMYSLNLVPIFINFSPIIIILNILTGYFGGYLRERERLWPIKGEELSEKVKNQINIFMKKTMPNKISFDSWPSD